MTKELIAPLELRDRAPAILNRYRALLSLTYGWDSESKRTTNPARLIRQRRENMHEFTDCGQAKKFSCVPWKRSRIALSSSTSHSIWDSAEENSIL